MIGLYGGPRVHISAAAPEGDTNTQGRSQRSRTLNRGKHILHLRVWCIRGTGLVVLAVLGVSSWVEVVILDLPSKMLFWPPPKSLQSHFRSINSRNVAPPSWLAQQLRAPGASSGYDNSELARDRHRRFGYVSIIQGIRSDYL